MFSKCDAYVKKFPWYKKGIQKAGCYSNADTFFAAVASGGAVFYNNAQTKWCSCKWLPPFILIPSFDLLIVGYLIVVNKAI